MLPVKGFSERWRSWLIAGACCIVNCLMYGVVRMSGLLLPKTMDTFKVPQGEASVPYTVSTSVRNLSGIFIGYFGQNFGLRPIISTGCILASLGAGLCFFTTDIKWFSVCWGIFGFGSGLATCFLPLAINQNFDEYRGTASGISYAGSYIGSLAFSPIVAQLLNYYGLKVTILVLSITLLNILAVSRVFRSSPVKVETRSNTTQSSTNNPNSLVTEAADSRFGILHKIFTFFICKMCNSHAMQKLHTQSPIYFISETETKDINKKEDLCLQIKEFDTEVGKKIPLHAISKHNSRKRRTQRVSFHSKFSFLKRYKSNSSYDFSMNRKLYRNKKEIRRISFDYARLLNYKELKKPGGLPHSNFFTPTTICSSVNVPTETSNGAYHTANIWSDIGNLKIGVVRGRRISCPTFTTFKSGDVNHTQDKNANIISKIPICAAPSVPISLYSFTGSKTTLSSSVFNDNSLVIKKKLSENEQLFKRSEKSTKRPALQQRDFVKFCFGWFRMYKNPMFLVISTTMSLHSLVVSCMLQIIEKYASDLGIFSDKEQHYVLMVLSTADLAGAFILGLMSDIGKTSKHYFIVFCFFGTGVSAFGLAFARSLSSLLTLLVFYGLFEIGVILTFPILMAQYIKAKEQPVALAASNILSSPTVLLSPLIIGYYQNRTYGVFLVLGVVSLCSCLIWLLAPTLISKCTKRWQQRIRKQPQEVHEDICFI